MTLTEAQPPIAESAGRRIGGSLQFVSFVVADQLFGIPVQAVQEVLNPQPITRIPRARPEIAGLLNLRGQIVTAVDLRHRLGLPDLPEDRPGMKVVVRQGNESFAFIVDRVGDVMEVSQATKDRLPPTLDANWKNAVTEVFRLEGRLLLVLNVAGVLNLNRYDAGAMDGPVSAGR